MKNNSIKKRKTSTESDLLQDKMTGVWSLPDMPLHCEEEFETSGFDILREMQERHFWYRGRHRFLNAAVNRAVLKYFKNEKISGIDFGGGCGGWIQYLLTYNPNLFSELALCDSSAVGLDYARSVVGSETLRYQLDLRNIPFYERWDVAFLCDVLEHIPEQDEVLQEIYKSLRPGGLLFVTVPALKIFWSYNDDIVKHVRRYSVGDFRILAEQNGYELLSARYFMFFLSPLVLLSRMKRMQVESMTNEQIAEILAKTHRTPHPWLNSILSGVFSLETPLGLTVPFPWGTSLLAVLRKPYEANVALSL